MSDNEEFREVADSFNRMAERLTEYRAYMPEQSILSGSSLHYFLHSHKARLPPSLFRPVLLIWKTPRYSLPEGSD